MSLKPINILGKPFTKYIIWILWVSDFYKNRSFILDQLVGFLGVTSVVLLVSTVTCPIAGKTAFIESGGLEKTKTTRIKIRDNGLIL
jgi:hypothetical protein